MKNLTELKQIKQTKPTKQINQNKQANKTEKVKRKKKLASKLHKVLSLVFIPIFLFIALSGIGLNHSSIIKNISLPISSLPDNYHFKQWNRGVIQTLAKDEKGGIYAAGKNGLGYFIDGSYQQINNPLAINSWQNFIYSLYFDKASEQLFIGSRDGLYRYQVATQQWHYYSQTSDQRIVSIVKSEQENAIIAIANHHIFTVDVTTDSKVDDKVVNKVKEHAVFLAKSSQTIPLFRFIFALHSGELLGIVGILLMDLVALSLIYFCLSGLYYWLFPKVVRKQLLSKKQQIKGGRAFRWLAKHHNSWGLVLAPLLIISAATAAVMRPPGLLLIVSGNSPIDVYSSHATENVPYKITKAALIENKLVLLTDDGVFSGDSNTAKFEQIKFSVPVHGMGATIFQQQTDGNILVGSFSGLFVWQEKNDSYEAVALPEDTKGILPVAAYQSESGVVVFDFFKGKLFDQTSVFSAMPDSINSDARMALWSFFFELHNLRIFQDYIGSFYLLLLLSVALALLIITITGIIQYLCKGKNSKVNVYN